MEFEKKRVSLFSNVVLIYEESWEGANKEKAEEWATILETFETEEARKAEDEREKEEKGRIEEEERKA